MGSKRSFAGYACQESLAIGLFGECFRAVNKAGKEARVVVVDMRLAKRKSFASALARHGTKLSNLVHPHLVTTQTVGRGKDGSLVVISSPVADPLELGVLIEREAGKLPQDIALSIAMGALQGLSHAHEHNVIHGGVHPRSVLVNGKGVTKLADLGLARALATAAAVAQDSELLKGLTGYVAPELALGNEPDVECDVFAAGALVSQLLWGQGSPPKESKGALADVLRQALATDTNKRFPNAGAFEKALRRAISDGDIEVAVASKVSDYLLHGHAERPDSVLDSATEDVLNSLAFEAQEEEGPRQSTALEEVLANMGGELEGVEDESSPGFIAPVPPTPPASTKPPEEEVDKNEAADEAADEDEDEDEDEPTQVEEAADYDEDPTAVEAQASMESSDAVEAIIRATTPTPAQIDPVRVAPKAPRPPSRPSRAKSTRAKLQEAPDDYDIPDDTRLPAPQPFHADGTHENSMVDLVSRQAAASSPFDDEEDLPVEEVVKGSNTLRLVALITFVFTILVAVAYTKTDLFEKSKKESEARVAEAMVEAEKLQPVPGKLTVISKEQDAAVWLLLGRTPMKSFILPSSMIHELRMDHEGFQPVFMSVAAQHWSGEDSARQATLSATLLPVEGDTPSALPAYPPIAKPPLTPGGPGQGMIVVDSTPKGAEVWMLVGSTPIMNLVGIEAGKDYSFKVLKDGFRPASASFKAKDWYLTGTSGPVKPELMEQVVLEAMPKASEGGSALPTAPENGEPDEGSNPEKGSASPRKMRRRSKKRR